MPLDDLLKNKPQAGKRFSRNCMDLSYTNAMAFSTIGVYENFESVAGVSYILAKETFLGSWEISRRNHG